MNQYLISLQMLTEISLESKRYALFLRDFFTIDDIQIYQSNGIYGQQDIFHFHTHVLPRHKDDGQNITRERNIVAEASLQSDYQKLITTFQN